MSNSDLLQPRRALLSVFDKTGIVEFAQALKENGVEILSSGGTAKTLKDAGIDVIGIDNFTGAAEMFDGRVKTLHPKIHGGILARRWKGDGTTPDDTAEMKKHNIPPIDLVCVNLYPFRDVVSKPDVELLHALENIDIGGPTLVRAAAKNFPSVCVVTDPKQYPKIIDALVNQDGISIQMREEHAREAFHQIAMYDIAIARYFRGLPAPDTDDSQDVERILPKELPIDLSRVVICRYGENPHQVGGYYRSGDEAKDYINDSEILQGKEISYNNLLDIDAVVRICREFPGEICATVVKHQSPTGVAVAETAADAYRMARGVDELAAFGNVTGISGVVDEEAARIFAEAFVEVIVAGDFTPEAREILKKKKNLRLVKTDLIYPAASGMVLDGRTLLHGFLVQESDTKLWDNDKFTIASKRQPTEDEMQAMELGWRVVKHVRSNATVVANRSQTLGTGPGQTSRVATFQIALGKAGENARGAVAATDGFCFPDSVEIAHAHGLIGIIEPGGSKQDKHTIAKADELGLILVLTGMRHFRH